MLGNKTSGIAICDKARIDRREEKMRCCDCRWLLVYEQGKRESVYCIVYPKNRSRR